MSLLEGKWILASKCVIDMLWSDSLWVQKYPRLVFLGVDALGIHTDPHPGWTSNLLGCLVVQLIIIITNIY